MTYFYLVTSFLISLIKESFGFKDNSKMSVLISSLLLKVNPLK